jgi:hypothetical protein
MSGRKNEIFVCYKILAISMSDMLQIVTSAIPDIWFLKHRAGLYEHPVYVYDSVYDSRYDFMTDLQALE